MEIKRYSITVDRPLLSDLTVSRTSVIKKMNNDENISKFKLSAREGALRILNNFNAVISSIELLSYAETAADFGDVDMYRKIMVRKYYKIPPIEALSYGQEISFQMAFGNLFRNAAVEKRDKFLHDIKDSNPDAVKEIVDFNESGNEDLDLARRYYFIFGRIDDVVRQMQTERTRKDVRDLVVPKQIDLIINNAHGLRKDIFAEIKERIAQEEEGLPFDQHWLSVWAHVRPSIEQYPQAYKAAMDFAKYSWQKLETSFGQMTEEMGLDIRKIIKK